MGMSTGTSVGVGTGVSVASAGVGVVSFSVVSVLSDCSAVFFASSYSSSARIRFLAIVQRRHNSADEAGIPVQSDRAEEPPMSFFSFLFT